jgi:hypothetical protein
MKKRDIIEHVFNVNKLKNSNVEMQNESRLASTPPQRLGFER